MKMFLNWKSALTSTLTSFCLGASSVLAEPVKEFYTMDSMGCMLLRECTKDVQQVFSINDIANACLLYTSPSPRDRTRSRMPSSA